LDDVDDFLYDFVILYHVFKYWLYNFYF